MIPAFPRTPELRRVQYWLSHEECKPGWGVAVDDRDRRNVRWACRGPSAGVPEGVDRPDHDHLGYPSGLDRNGHRFDELRDRALFLLGVAEAGFFPGIIFYFTSVVSER
jgi:hypothetical protein